MINMLKNFMVEEQGQDLIEYTLLLAFVCLASAAIFITLGADAAKVWSKASVQMASAASAAS